MGNRRAVITRKGGELRYNVRDNASSEWRHAISGPHVKVHIEKVKAAIAQPTPPTSSPPCAGFASTTNRRNTMKNFYAVLAFVGTAAMLVPVAVGAVAMVVA
jgi:hypothetical protein